jgi:H+/Cl- antiporter ClcA
VAAPPKLRAWLLVLGIVGSMATATIAWVVHGFEDFERPPWIAAIFLILLYGGPWSLGVGMGYLLRKTLDHRLRARRTE